MSFDDDMSVIQRFMLQRLTDLIEWLIRPCTERPRVRTSLLVGERGMLSGPITCPEDWALIGI